MADRERAAGRSVRILFNGDFNWFNTDDELFTAINRRLLKYDAMLGNVEYELATPSPEAGCGCAYPEFVEEAVVERSNRIMGPLQKVAGRHAGIQEQLRQLPRWRSLILGGLKVLVLHGDPESLAGWGLSRESLLALGDRQLADWFRRTGADVIASTHTCLPVTWSGEVDGQHRLFMNNGSAGMGNLQDDGRGLITRLSAHPSLQTPVVEHQLGSMKLSLESVAFDLAGWLELFDRLWPPGSDAELSYRQRIISGTGLIAGDLRQSLSEVPGS
jgi:diadenosine tetraphosphatase ApaH/serine/threonine PP2A family protein phosphatase